MIHSVLSIERSPYLTWVTEPIFEKHSIHKNQNPQTVLGFNDFEYEG